MKMTIEFDPSTPDGRDLLRKVFEMTTPAPEGLVISDSKSPGADEPKIVAISKEPEDSNGVELKNGVSENLRKKVRSLISHCATLTSITDVLEVTGQFGVRDGDALNSENVYKVIGALEAYAEEHKLTDEEKKSFAQ